MRLLTSFQRRLGAAFGLSADDLRACVAEMLAPSRKHPAAYWLQIVLSLGIATLGLVLGSTAVVIGAMLVSPLMGPIVELAMGLAIGSPVLVVRAAARVGASVVVVVGIAALIVRALPFQEVTSEVSSRTSPTALDLGVAIFCAGAAAYTTIERGSDKSATAAGTAIGIALVPPLCVVGFGIGIGSFSIAKGAGLLFTANFSAIVLFDSLAFLSLGYGRLDVSALEHAELERAGHRALTRTTRALSQFLHSRSGRVMRLLTPLLLVGVVYVPLRQALHEMTWQITTRTAVQHTLAGVSQRAVRSSVTVEHHAIAIHLVIVGSSADAARIHQDLIKHIAARTGVVPSVTVMAVPDDATLRATEIASRTPPPAEQLATVESCVGGALEARWPKEAVGDLARWRLDLSGSMPEVHVVHLGAPLGAAATHVLAADVQACLGEARVVDRAFSPDEWAATAEDGARWLDDTLPRIGRLREEPSIRACLESPASEGDAGAGILRVALAGLADRVDLAETSRWSFRFTTAPCPPPNLPLDAGAAD